MPFTELEQPTPWQRVAPLLRGFDWGVLLPVLALAACGLVVMYSAGADYGTRFADHARNMLIAAALLFGVAQIPPQHLMKAALPLYLLGLALLLAVALFGTTKNGAQRWLNVGMVIQPSELLKIATPLVLAWWFHQREGLRRGADFVLAFIVVLVPVALIMRQPDLGTALLVLAAGASVIFFAGLPWKFIAPPLALALVGMVLLLWNEPRWCTEGVRWPLLHDYQQTRVCTLLDPTRDPLGRGFHIIQGTIAIGSGGLWGKGFMAGTQTHLQFIPERTTDFIFAVWSEEFGLAGNLFLLACFLALVWRALLIATRAQTVFEQLIAAALAVMFFAYAFVNMGMVSGILPVVGVPLPFISYGGTAMVTLGLALGVLMAVARTQRHVTEAAAAGQG